MWVLVINSLGGGHTDTNTHAYRHLRTEALQAAPGLKISNAQQITLINSMTTCYSHNIYASVTLRGKYTIFCSALATLETLPTPATLETLATLETSNTQKLATLTPATLETVVNH